MIKNYKKLGIIALLGFVVGIFTGNAVASEGFRDQYRETARRLESQLDLQELFNANLERLREQAPFKSDIQGYDEAIERGYNQSARIQRRLNNLQQRNNPPRQFDSQPQQWLPEQNESFC